MSCQNKSAFLVALWDWCEHNMQFIHQAIYTIGKRSKLIEFVRKWIGSDCNGAIRYFLFVITDILMCILKGTIALIVVVWHKAGLHSQYWYFIREWKFHSITAAMGFQLRDKILCGYPIIMKFTFFVRMDFQLNFSECVIFSGRKWIYLGFAIDLDGIWIFGTF